jgi:DNA/RNA-binding domain of Phe-tRNA-synthetase-like protein
LRVAPEIESRVRLGVVSAEPVDAGPARPALVDEIGTFCSDLGRRFAGTAPGEIEAAHPARALYRAFGVDPTKVRPSSEALLRRVLRGDDLPRISGPVDLANLLALRFLLPIGLYDADRLAGDVVARVGGPAESYAGIRKDEVHLGGRLVLADAAGPFGNPTSDSLRAAVVPSTRRLLLVVFAPASFETARMTAHVEEAGAAIERHLAAPGERATTTGNVFGS